MNTHTGFEIPSKEPMERLMDFHATGKHG